MPSEAQLPRPRVTVVVPVYGDLESLLNCVDALKVVLDKDKHDVLLVNDCGPDADTIESALLARIDGLPNFRYARNSRNLGFVGTCNRAVEELDRSDNDVLLLNSDTEPTAGFIDEMHSVLYADSRHGVVCARSNNATIASLPYRMTGRAPERSTVRTKTVFGAVAGELPRWSISPVAMGFCFLARRSLIERFGLFDEAFAPGYGEENDFCLRIDKEGFRSVIANRALVIHEGSKSFVGERRNTLRDAHQIKLEARYPYYSRATRAFMRFGISAVERFADAIVPGPRYTFGFDIRGLASVGDEVLRRNVVAQVRSTALELSRNSDVEVLADPADLVALRLNPARIRQSSDVTTDEVLHVGVLLAGGLDTDQLAIANRRYAFWSAWDAASEDAPWEQRVARLGRDLAGEALMEHSVARFAGGSVPTGDALRQIVADQHGAGVAEIRKTLDARWQAFRLVDSVPRAAAGSEARARRLEAEIASLRESMSYRIGSKAVGVAKRIVRR